MSSVRKEKTKEIKLLVPESTYEAMSELVAIAGHKGKHRFARLVQDILREHEWLIFRQARDEQIVSLKKEDIAVLEKSKKVSGEREQLVLLFEEDTRTRVKEYFAKLE